jgi:prepilin-type N-terminal cleavage/methylation domain-containing protein
MVRRAFTLMELLVALALVLLLGGLVVSFSAGSGREAAWDDAPHRLTAAMLQARAEAQRSGQVVLVVAVKRLDGSTDLAWRTLEPDPEEESSSFHAGAVTMATSDPIALPAGLSLSEPREGQGDDRSGPRGDSTADETVIALFLPDGRGAARAVNLTDSAGRLARVEVNPWTGRVSLGALGTTGSGAEAGEVVEETAP